MTNFCNEIPGTTTLGNSHYFPPRKLSNPFIILQLNHLSSSPGNIETGIQRNLKKNQSLFPNKKDG